MPLTALSQTPSRRFIICLTLLTVALLISIVGTIAFVYVFVYNTHSKALSTALLEQSISPISVDRAILDTIETTHAFKIERTDKTYPDPFIP